MKTYEIIKRNIMPLLLLATAGVFGSCSQTEIDMLPADNSGIISTVIQKGWLADGNAIRKQLTTEVREGVGSSGSVTLYLNATKQAEAASEVSLTYDTDLLDAYNETTGNAYEALPQEALQLSGQTFSLEAGSQRSESVTVSYTLTAEQSADQTYVIPLRAEVVSGPLELNAEDAGYLIFLQVVENPGDCNKGADAAKVFYVMETNDVNPLNMLSFRLADSRKYLFDAVVLFSDNIVLDHTGLHALVNDNVRYLLNNREKYLAPLQERGMKVYLGMTPYHTHAGLSTMLPATADYFARQLKIICDTYSLDGVFFDDEYTSLEDTPPTGFLGAYSKEAAAYLLYATKRIMPERDVIAYQLGMIRQFTTEGCKFEDETGKVWGPGDYIDYIMVDYSDGDDFNPANFPGVPENRVGRWSTNFGSTSPSWPLVERLEQTRDIYKTLFLFSIDPYRSNGSFNTTPIGNREKLTQVQALNRVCETLYGEALEVGDTYRKDW